MLHVAHTVHIDAPPAKVWEVMVDVERWPSFAPQLRSIERREAGPLRLGSSARVTPNGFFGSDWVVTEYSDGRSFAWETNAGPGWHMAAGHVVEPETGGARVTLSLKSSGLLATLLSPILGVIFRRNTRQEGEGMKAYCEGAMP